MTWSLRDFYFNRRRNELAVGQVRQIAKPIGEEPRAGLEVGDKVIIKGPGEYGGWDVEILLTTGERIDIGAKQLLDHSVALGD